MATRKKNRTTQSKAAAQRRASNAYHRRAMLDADYRFKEARAVAAELAANRLPGLIDKMEAVMQPPRAEVTAQQATAAILDGGLSAGASFCMSQDQGAALIVVRNADDAKNLADVWEELLTSQGRWAKGAARV